MHGFELQLLPVDGARRRAEGDLAADPPEPARLRAAVGLGRDELDRAQGSAGHRLPAREDVRRVVGRRRARRQGRRRGRQGLQRAWRCSTAPSRSRRWSRTSWSTCTTRARARARRKRSARCCTCAALIIGHARRRRRARARRSASARARSMTRRAGALGPGEPGARPEEARRARLRRRDAADQHLVRRPHGRDWARIADLGRQEVGRSAPTGCRPTSRSSSRWSRRRPTSTRPRRS